jgi:hypothetical protein
MIARFVKGNTKFDLTTNGFSLGDDFAPPSTPYSYNIASGNALNSYGGGELISEQADDVSFSFTVRVLGSGDVLQKGRELQSFLRDCDYFEFSPFDLPEPLRGQFGAPGRYEVITASAGWGKGYSSAVLRQSGVEMAVSITAKPHALGSREPWAMAIGGVVEDTFGRADGTSRGVRVPSATTNKIAHCTTLSGAWTNGSNLDRWYMYGKSIPGSDNYFTLISTDSISNDYLISINVGNTNQHTFWAIVSKQGGGAVTSSDISIAYDVNQQPAVVTDMGNGYYAAQWTGAGIALPTLTGIMVSAGRNINIHYYCVEEKPYRSAFGHGGFMGWSWSGTPFQSTCTRAAAKLAYPMYVGRNPYINPAEGAFFFVWKPDTASTEAGDRYFLDTSASYFSAYFNATDDKYYFTDGTNTISTAAQVFVAGSVQRLIFGYGPSGLTIDVNGSQAASGAAYADTPFTGVTDLIYIGSDAAGANQCEGVIMGRTIYGHELTLAERGAIATGALKLINADQRVDYIPWLYTAGLTNAMHGVTDSTYKNYGAFGGIPGDVPPMIELVGVNPSSIENWLTVNPAENYYPPSSLFYDKSGTAQAGLCGGQYQVISVGTTDTEIDHNDITHTPQIREMLMGRTVDVFFSLRDAAAPATLIARVDAYVGGTAGQLIRGKEFPISIGTSFSFYHVGGVTLPLLGSLLADYADLADNKITLVTSVRRTTGTANVWVDYVGYAAGSTTFIKDAGHATLILSNREALGGTNTLSLGGINLLGNLGTASMRGDSFDLEPGRINLLTHFNGTHGAAHPAISSSLNGIYGYITPRWRMQ